MAEGSFSQRSETINHQKSPPRERTAVTPDQERARQAELLGEQLQHAATFALLHARDYQAYSGRDAHMDTPSYTTEFRPAHSTVEEVERAQSAPERRAQELLASHEFQACTRQLQASLQRSMNEAYASLETNADHRRELSETGRATPQNLPGANAIMRRTMLLGSMPALVKMVERWKRSDARHNAQDDKVPAQVSAMIDEYAKRVVDGFLFERNREPAAALARTVAESGTERRQGVTVGKEITAAASTYVHDLETHQPAGLGRGPEALLELNPEKWRELMLTVAPMVAEMRGYNGAPAELSLQDRQSLNMPQPRVLSGYDRLVDPAELVAPEAHIAGKRRGEADEVAAQTRLEALSEKQTGYAALQRRKTEIAQRIRSLSFDTEEERNGRYAEQRLATFGQEQTSEERAIAAQERVIRGIELRQQVALREYQDAIPGLPSRNRARAEYQKREQELIEAQNRLIELQSEWNKRDNFATKLDEVSAGAVAAGFRALDQQKYSREEAQLAQEPTHQSPGEQIEEQGLRAFLARRAKQG